MRQFVSPINAPFPIFSETSWNFSKFHIRKKQTCCNLSQRRTHFQEFDRVAMSVSFDLESPPCRARSRREVPFRTCSAMQEGRLKALSWHAFLSGFCASRQCISYIFSKCRIYRLELDSVFRFRVRPTQSCAGDQLWVRLFSPHTANGYFTRLHFPYRCDHFLQTSNNENNPSNNSTQCWSRWTFINIHKNTSYVFLSMFI